MSTDAPRRELARGLAASRRCLYAFEAKRVTTAVAVVRLIRAPPNPPAGTQELGGLRGACAAAEPADRRPTPLAMVEHMRRRLRGLCGFTICLVLCACSGSGRFERRPGETVVEIRVDGEPVSEVTLPEDLDHPPPD